MITIGSLLLDMDEVLPVIKEHHSKFMPVEALPEFKLDVNSLLELEISGLFISNKLEVEGKLVGFISSIVGPDLHYMGTKCCHVNVLYISPNRGKRLIQDAKDLITAHEELAKRAGVNQMYFGAAALKDITPIIEKMGYTKAEIVSVKRLGV